MATFTFRGRPGSVVNAAVVASLSVSAHPLALYASYVYVVFALRPTRFSVLVFAVTGPVQMVCGPVSASKYQSLVWPAMVSVAVVSPMLETARPMSVVNDDDVEILLASVHALSL